MLCHLVFVCGLFVIVVLVLQHVLSPVFFLQFQRLTQSDLVVAAVRGAVFFVIDLGLSPKEFHVFGVGL